MAGMLAIKDGKPTPAAPVAKKPAGKKIKMPITLAALIMQMMEKEKRIKSLVTKADTPHP